MTTDYHFNELILNANTLIDRYDSLSNELKRRNSLLILAQKFHKYEERCLKLADKGVDNDKNNNR